MKLRKIELIESSNKKNLFGLLIGIIQHYTTASVPEKQ